MYDANSLNQYTSIAENGGAPFIPQFDADGNQTLIKTETGIWSAVYNAENRSVCFTNTESNTVVECQYDSMGRRAYKKVTVNGSVTLHQRYIYRGYLQIACVDLTRSHHPVMWLLTWDPTQNVATRPLAIQINGTWYTYGWDLTKNICELYSTAGTLTTSYTYSPFGQVTATGLLTQAIQWSSEVWDAEVGLVYYNWRFYDVLSGRWIGRDIDKAAELTHPYHYASNNPTYLIDFNGLQTKECVAYKSNEQILDEVRAEFHPILQWVGDTIDIWNLLKIYDRRMKASNCTKISTTVILENSDLLARGGINSYTIIRRPIKACSSELCFAGRGVGGMRNKGERNLTSKSSGPPSPFKHMKPDPKNKNRVIVTDSNGKQVSKPKPKGFDDFWNNKHR